MFKFCKLILFLFALALCLSTGCAQARATVEGIEISANIKKLKNNDPDKREEAALMLMNLDIKAYPGAIGALVGALNDESPEVREAVIDALLMNGVEAERIMPTLKVFQSDIDPLKRRDAARFLKYSGYKTDEAVSLMENALVDESRSVRNAGYEALWRMNLEKEHIIGILLELINHECPKIRAEAISALYKIEPEAKDVLPALLETINDESAEVRSQTAMLLGLIGPEAESAVPGLIENLGDESNIVRLNTAAALISIDPDSNDMVVSALIGLINSGSTLTRVVAFSHLAYSDLDAEAAIPAVMKALEDDSICIRLSALGTIGHIAPAQEAVQIITKYLENENPQIRAQAVFSLGEIGSEAKEMVPVIIEMLNDTHWKVRTGAVLALSLIGVDASEALPILRDLAENDESKFVRKAAELAISEINEAPSKDEEPIDTEGEGA
jgi:HEAT repeat protein